MKFAFIIMGDFDFEKDYAQIHNGTAQIVGVSTIDEACQAAGKLCDDGIDCIELCGAFGAEGARKVIQATNNSVPVGYITHLPEQDDLYSEKFKNN